MKMMPDGTALQNSTKMSSGQPLDLRYAQLGVIKKLFYSDDDDSPDKNSMMAIIELTSNGTFVETPPVRFASGIKAGIENIFTVTPRASKATYDQSDYNDKSGDKDRTDETISDGDIVMVNFVNGNPYFGFVTNFISHGEASKELQPVREDGEQLLMQHQGMRFKIDKVGDLTIESFESKLPEFKNENPKRTLKIKMKDKDGKGCEVIVDNKTNTIELKADGDTVGKMTLTGDGLVVEGATNIDLIAPTINAEGDLIDLKGAEVNVGAGASKKAVLGEEIMTFLKTFVTIFNAHTHIAPQAPAGALPTAPPATIAQNPEPTLLSDTVKLSS